MRKKKGFVLRDICGEHIIVSEGMENIDFSKIINLNDSAAFLWQAAGDGDFDAALLAAKLTEEYDVDKDTALADATEMARQWMEAGIAE